MKRYLIWLAIVGCGPDNLARIRQLGGRDPIACVENIPILTGPQAKPAVAYYEFSICHDVSDRYFVCYLNHGCVDVRDALAVWQRLPPW